MIATLTLRALWGGPGGGTNALLDRLPRRPDARVWADQPAHRDRRRVGANSLKLLLIIASSHDGDRLIDTILSGVDDDNVDIVMELTRRECQMRKELVPTQGLPVFGEVSVGAAPIEVQVGGATVFVMDVARFEHF